MQQVRLGGTGLKVSRLCLGCMTYGSPSWRPWVLDEEQSRPMIRRALEQGITFFDTADMYSLGRSEEIVGKILLEHVRRDDVVIATKLFNKMSDAPNDRGLSRKHVMAAIDDSLRRLGTDYIDLYQIHRMDPETPWEETLDALNDVVRAGKVRYLGASSMYAWQFMKALGIQEKNGWAKFVAMQPHYNLIYREEEREMLPLCRAEGIGVIPWSPLARGFLAGNRQLDGDRRTGATARAETDGFAKHLYYQPQDFTVAARVQKLAEKRGHAPAQLALAWMLSKPVVTAPIIGATTIAQLDQLVGALEVPLTFQDVAYLEEPYQPKAVAGHD